MVKKKRAYLAYPRQSVSIFKKAGVPVPGVHSRLAGLEFRLGEIYARRKPDSTGQRWQDRQYHLAA